MMLNFLTKIRIIWNWAFPVFSKATTLFLRHALPIASEVIISYVNMKMSNEEKRKNAMEDIKNKLAESNVLNISDSRIDLAFSMAYRKWKEEQEHDTPTK